jgi:hypothetical protein
MGCQRGQTWNLAPVEGTVIKGGSPLKGIQVDFMPDTDAGTVGPRASGTTDEAGHYRLRTDNGDDGAVVGKHRVVIRDLEARKGRRRSPARGPQSEKVEQMLPENVKRLKDGSKPAAEASRLPSRYGSFNETPLRHEVRPGEQVIDLEVK